MMAEQKVPLLVSFHREWAEHQKVALVHTWYDQVQGQKLDLDEIRKNLSSYLDYCFLHEEFDIDRLEESAEGRVKAMDEEVSDWRERPLLYEPPGLVAAAKALENVLLDAKPQGPVYPVRLAIYRDENKEIVEPVVFILTSVDPALGSSSEAQPLRPAREMIKELLPKEAMLLDLGSTRIPDDMLGVIESQLPDPYEKVKHLWAGRDTSGKPFPLFGQDPKGFVEKLRQWLACHPATVSFRNDWGNVPLILSWFGADPNRCLAAAAYLHGCTGGFPTFVFYALTDASSPAEVYSSYEPHLVPARTIRQLCHPEPGGGIAAIPGSVPENGGAVRVPDEPCLTAPAVLWMISRWPRLHGHILRNTDGRRRRCQAILNLPLTDHGSKLGDLHLEDGVSRRYSSLCYSADGATIETTSWQGLVCAAWGFAYSVARSYRKDPRWCRGLCAHLQAASDGNGVSVACDDDLLLVLDGKELQAITRDMCATACQRGGENVWLGARVDDKVWLGLAHDGTAPDRDALLSIKGGGGGGTKNLLRFAEHHLATLRLYWREGSGVSCLSSYGGRWTVDDEGVRANDPPNRVWEEVPGSRPSLSWPANLTTLWEFELDRKALEIPEEAPLPPSQS